MVQFPDRTGPALSVPARDRARGVIEIAVFFAVVLAFVLLALSLVDAQASLSDDRVGLLALRERWAAAAAGYGLWGNLETSTEDFVVEYRRFRSRPSFRELVRVDTTFAALAASTDTALDRLVDARKRGYSLAEQAVSAVDFSLDRMADRVGVWSRERLDRSRILLAALATALAGLGASFLLLERRLRRSSADERRSRALSRALIAAIEGERLRLARELHDAVAQDLAAARLYAGLAGGDDSARASGLIERAIGEVREICHGLRPAELDRLGLAEASARLCAESDGLGGVRVEFRAEGSIGLRFEPETEINFYRILQEALANVRHHAGAGLARVSLRMMTDRLELRVEDDGKGPGSAPPGLGRTGMEERARMMDGEFSFAAAPGGGAVLSVSAPARPPAPAGPPGSVQPEKKVLEAS